MAIRSSLALVLVAQAVFALRLTWSNTAFADEALYLWAGRIELDHWLHGTPIPQSVTPFASYFSGAPVIYPPLGAMAALHGGLAAARLLSLAFMLGATGLLYLTAARLFGRLAALSAAAVFACYGPTQFLSAFATYDPMALFLLALSAWLATRAAGRAGELMLIMCAGSLALADATKYAASLWDPVVIALVVLTATRDSWLRAGLRAARLTVYLAGILAMTVCALAGKLYIRGIMVTTLMRQVSSTPSPTSLVLGESLWLLWILAPLALIAVVVSWRGSRRLSLLCIALTAALFLAPLHQAQIHTVVALHKHADFGAWFAAMPVGYVIAKGVRLCGSKGWRVLAAAASVIALVGITQVDSLFIAGWPNMAAADAVLGKMLRTARCPCLISADNVAEYYFFNEFSPARYGRIWGTYFFAYNDRAEGRELTGMTAYVQAIRNHYFSLIEIDPGEYQPAYAAVRRALARSGSYRLVRSFPIAHWGRQRIEIWRYRPAVRRKGLYHALYR